MVHEYTVILYQACYVSEMHAYVLDLIQKGNRNEKHMINEKYHDQ